MEEGEWEKGKRTVWKAGRDQELKKCCKDRGNRSNRRIVQYQIRSRRNEQTKGKEPGLKMLKIHLYEDQNALFQLS